SVVGLAWWTDHVGRKHFRVVGHRAKFNRPHLKNILDPAGQGWPPLALVYPDYLFFKTCRGERVLTAVCACGVFGPPERLAWMGNCCGPCHDGREEGREPERLGPDPRTTALTDSRSPYLPYR